MNKLLIALLGTVLFTGTSVAQQQTYFTNPVIHGDVADPSILRINDTYYATGTSSEWAPYYPVFTSTDLVNWKQTGHIFTEQPEWTKSSFWAPELFYYKGKVYVYYTARMKSNNSSYIGVAVADSPTGKFKDYGPVVEFEKEAIDAFVMEDKGELYITWKAYGLDNRPIDFDKIKRATEELSERYDSVLLEGAGGLMVPLTTELLTIDYIAQENYPLIFVTSGKLGSINHTLLSLEAIQKRGIVLDTVLYNMYPTVKDKTIQNDTMNFIQNWLKKYFPDTKFILVPEIKE